MKDRILEIIKETSGVPKKYLLDGVLLDEIGITELDGVEICVNLETEYDIAISDADWEKVETVKDVVSLVERLRR